MADISNIPLLVDEINEQTKTLAAIAMLLPDPQGAAILKHLYLLITRSNDLMEILKDELEHRRR